MKNPKQWNNFNFFSKRVLIIGIALLIIVFVLFKTLSSPISQNCEELAIKVLKHPVYSRRVASGLIGGTLYGPLMLEPSPNVIDQIMDSSGKRVLGPLLKIDEKGNAVKFFDGGKSRGYSAGEVSYDPNYIAEPVIKNSSLIICEIAGGGETGGGGGAGSPLIFYDYKGNIEWRSGRERRN
ncbi:MAG: hypothetical protein ACK5C4_07400 [Pseudanabaena sp.]|jgi:hypothetical protein